MQSLNHADLATTVLVMAILFLTLVVIILWFVANQIDMVRYEQSKQYQPLINEMLNFDKSLIKQLQDQTKQMQGIKEILYQPLYDVGNTVWYNKGLIGEQGIFENLKGKIVAVLPTSGEPMYEVLGRGGISETIMQSHITEWTN